MARVQERNFSPSQPLYAVKVFRASGREYVVGAKFDWRKLSVSPRRVKQMFDMRLIDHSTIEADSGDTENTDDTDDTPVITDDFPSVSVEMRLKDLQSIAQQISEKYDVDVDIENTKFNQVKEIERVRDQLIPPDAGSDDESQDGEE